MSVKKIDVSEGVFEVLKFRGEQFSLPPKLGDWVFEVRKFRVLKFEVLKFRGEYFLLTPKLGDWGHGYISK